MFRNKPKRMEVIRFGGPFGHGAIVRVHKSNDYCDYTMVPRHKDKEEHSSLNQWVDLSGSGDYEYAESDIGNFYEANYRTR